MLGVVILFLIMRPIKTSAVVPRCLLMIIIGAVLAVDGPNACLLACLRVPSGLLRTRTADFELAFRALPDEPVRARVAHVAVPQYERRVRLDDLEDVCAFPRLRHGQCLQI